MKTKLLLIGATLGLIATTAFGQGQGLPAANASLEIRLPGTMTSYSGDTFMSTDVISFDLWLIFGGTSPSDAESVSYWFEVPSELAAFITVADQNESGSMFSIANGPIPQAFNTPTSGGFVRHADDLGQEATSGLPANSYFLSNLDFNLTNAPVGTYTLRTTTAPPSSVSSSGNEAFALPVESFTITIVPEPSTWALLGAGLAGLVTLNRFRGRQKK